jgi:Na+/H+ antiporter NhaC
VLLSGGTIFGAFAHLVEKQFLPIFGSSWKLSAMLFTLILGGFVALIEAGGGLQALVRRLLGSGRAPRKRMQTTVFGFGLLVFFDGLANTMLIGRLLRSAADRCGVSREKLAYLADTTGSAVACLAFISTWIAFQLSMIREGFALAGEESVSAYAYFFRSLPANFYCWFALVLALVCVWREFNPGPMGRAEAIAKSRQKIAGESTAEPVGDGSEAPATPQSHWGLAIFPILMLTLSIPLLSYAIGAEDFWPFSLVKFAEAYGRAEVYVPQILVVSCLFASLVAAVAYRYAGKTPSEQMPPEERPREAAQPASRRPGVAAVFLSGVREIAGPVCILIAAWMLGSAISGLGTAVWLSEQLAGQFPASLLPAGIFVLGALISFATGTSWGTMGVLMPLAIPVIFGLTEGGLDAERDRLVVAAVGAVFSGAVFGDHCSPFSDTTIVSSIASGVEPFDHVRTQLPFALIAGGAALLLGFFPLGLGVPAGIALVLGAVVLGVLPSVFGRGGKRAHA